MSKVLGKKTNYLFVIKRRFIDNSEREGLNDGNLVRKKN